MEAGCFREVAALHSDHLRQIPLYYQTSHHISHPIPVYFCKVQFETELDCIVCLCILRSFHPLTRELPRVS